MIDRTFDKFDIDRKV